MTCPKSPQKEGEEQGFDSSRRVRATLGCTILATVILCVMYMTLDLNQFLKSWRISGSPPALLRDLSVLPSYWFQMPFGTRARLTSSGSQGKIIFFFNRDARIWTQGYKFICLFWKVPQVILVSSQEEVRFMQPGLPDMSSLCWETFRSGESITYRFDLSWYLEPSFLFAWTLLFPTLVTWKNESSGVKQYHMVENSYSWSAISHPISWKCAALFWFLKKKKKQRSELLRMQIIRQKKSTVCLIISSLQERSKVQKEGRGVERAVGEEAVDRDRKGRGEEQVKCALCCGSEFWKPTFTLTQKKHRALVGPEDPGKFSSLMHKIP